MPDKILFVDDEPNILATFKRNLHKKYTVEVAEGPEQGLEIVRRNGPFAVVVSDLKMPGMDGISFLERVRERSPDTVRVILSGQGDFDAALEAVNRGAVFRFLTKPCPPDVLVSVLREGLRQYRLITAEKELLRGTLLGSIKVLVDVLSLVSPDAFGRSERIRSMVSALGRRLGESNLWQLDVAAMLCQLGCVGLPSGLLRKVLMEEPLSTEESQAFAMHPSVGANLLANIPRMAGVAAIIAHQLEGHSLDNPLGARILRAVLDYDKLEQQGLPPHEAVDKLVTRNATDRYDPLVLNALRDYLVEREGGEIRTMRLEHLEPGMILAKNLINAEGTVLMLRGQTLTDNALKRLRALSDLLQVDGTMHILIPLRDGSLT